MVLRRTPTADSTEAALSRIEEAIADVADVSKAPRAVSAFDAGLEVSQERRRLKAPNDPSEAKLSIETVRKIQAEADKILAQEEWVQIDGFVARR